MQTATRKGTEIMSSNMRPIWTRFDIDSAKQSPTSCFCKPNDVLSEIGLAIPDKIAILKQWEIDARALQRASEENMSGGESALLDEVHAALKTLDPELVSSHEFGDIPSKL
jgi:hypothetical protein